MDPEKPPRRKKSGETPVTIDLEAKPASEARDTPETTLPTEAVSAEPAADTKPEAYVPPPADDTSATAASGETDNTYVPPYETASSPAQPSPSKSGAFAAAILGGLVALAGAGALQYGGYLPALGPERDSSVDLAPLNAEIDALKSQVASINTTAPAPTVDLQPIEARLAALETAATGSPAATARSGEEEQSIASLEASVAKLTADITALRDETVAADRTAADQTAALTQRIDAAERKLDEPRTDVAMARAVAATALKTAIDRGGPYLAELDAFASISPDDPAVATLRPRAATGVPSRADLVRDFGPVADQMIEAVHQPTGDQGIVDRLLSSASSAIKIRPVGNVEGDAPEAIIARIENKLQNGDLRGAQIEWQTLPEVARNAGAAFKTTLDERIAVEDGVNAIVSGAMSSNGNQG
ncbi:COG4223 family protein [Rhizobium sp. ARZ01]|uniref:COG4223 family protein n=1 Tax=Rhizobium sp. ARZ01 TaxID=2769313 RepID=UPI00178586BE|nr:COG4223 family protein [Rhizobium sp. ARZ01]MBD9374798.1 COG4223 family protein [Rhizobium sp. ARZ01]